MRALPLLAVLIVETLAGSRNGGGFREGIGAAARFSGPSRVAACGGALYVAETGSHVIRKVTRNGVVTTWAGAGAEPGSADGDRFTARFRGPAGVAADERCTLYVADAGNHTIRRITPEGGVTTIAGEAGVRGDGNHFFEPTDVAIAADGTLFICDRSNSKVKMLANGQITTIASTGLSFPPGIALDHDGTVLIADLQNQMLRRATREGVMTNVAKVGFVSDIDVAADGTIYIADDWNAMVSRLGADGAVVPVAGVLARSEHRDGRGEEARFYNPTGIAWDRAGFLWVTDFRANTVRIVQPDGVATTLAGSVALPDDAPFLRPHDVAAGPDGSVFVSDNAGVSRIAADGTVTRLADVPAHGIAVAPNGDVIASDVNNHVIRRITPTGVVTVIAGTSGRSGLTDGRGAAARFHSPYDVGVGSDGTIYVADTLNRAMRRIVGDQVTTIPHDRTGLSTPVGLYVDGESNLYFWDENTAGLFRVRQNGERTTLVQDRALAGWMGRVARAADGTFYIAAWRGDAIRRITTGGKIEVFAGEDFGPGNQNGTLDRARFSRPGGIDIAADGTILLADSTSFAVRAIRPTAKPYIAAFNGTAERLTWTVRNATAARIEPGIGDVPLEGSRSISPAKSTAYTLIVTGPEGETRETLFVTIERKRRSAPR